MNSPLKFVNHKIEDFAIQVTFDPVAGEGNVVYNLSLIKNEDLEFAISVLKNAYRAGISVSGLVKFFKSGETIADFVVPDGDTAICTMCSMTFDGLLINRGIPINPIGGGVVEIENRTPIRFTHIILYEYTTIDPLQVLISQKTTAVTSVMRKGSGSILANIREFHMEAEPLVSVVLDELSSSSYSGILEVGMPNLPLLGVPVSPQYVGIAAIGGTNPLAAIREGGRPVRIQAMKGLIDVKELEEIRTF
ncbi:MAG: Global nitrogen regulator NrpRII [Methanoregula sp. SKADARSKE-2]|nr:MAG: Global nitrogen regulator NrpRII [Methanoregula sp. SKADARSKE-2]